MNKNDKYYVFELRGYGMNFNVIIQNKSDVDLIKLILENKVVPILVSRPRNKGGDEK